MNWLAALSQHWSSLSLDGKVIEGGLSLTLFGLGILFFTRLGNRNIGKACLAFALVLHLVAWRFLARLDPPARPGPAGPPEVDVALWTEDQPQPGQEPAGMLALLNRGPQPSGEQIARMIPENVFAISVKLATPPAIISTFLRAFDALMKRSISLVYI